MWVWTGESYRNIDAAEETTPALKGTRCEVFVKYPDKKEPVLITGAQANGVLEYVLRRRVSSTNDALETIFKKVEEAQDISQSNGNGHKPRRKRVLRNPEESKRRMSEAALKRWARERQQRETLAEAAPPT